MRSDNVTKGAERAPNRSLFYALGYTKAVEKRVPGFGIQALACLLLLVGAVIGLIRHIPN